MDTPPVIAEVQSLLERLSIPDLEARLVTLRAEDKALRVLLRTLRAREAMKRRKALQQGEGSSNA